MIENLELNQCSEISSVYDIECNSVNELLYRLITNDKNFITYLENKTDLYGDHKGTWQGLKPTQTDIGLGAQVEKNTIDINSLLPLLNNKIYIDKLPNFNPDNISTTINNIEFLEGYTYILDLIECKNRTLITIKLPPRCNLIINSKVTCYSSFMEIYMQGSNKLYIKELNAVSVNVYEKGVHIVNANESDIFIDRIVDFKKCLVCKPMEEWNWLQYNKINFYHLIGDIGLDISVTNANSWVNENTFNGGGFGGRININMYKDFNDTNYRSLINNNKFYNIGLNSTEEGIKIAKSSGETNYFYNLRTWEQEEVFVGTYVINDNGGSNYFECMSGLKHNQIKLGADSKLDSVITGSWDSSSNSFPLIGYTAYGDRDTSKPYRVEKVLTDVSTNFSNGAFNLYTVTNMLGCNMGNAQTGTVNLKETLFFRNNIFYFRKGGWNNGTGVTFVTPTGKSLTIEQNGLYVLSLNDGYDYFEVFKIFDGDPLTPQ